MSVEGNTRVGNRLESYAPPSRFCISIFPIFFSVVVFYAIPYNQSAVLRFILVPLSFPLCSHLRCPVSLISSSKSVTSVYSLLIDNEPSSIFTFQGNKSFVAFSNLNDSETLTKTWKVLPSFHIPHRLFKRHSFRSAQKLQVTLNRVSDLRT